MHTRMSIPRAATRLCLEHGADETSTDSNGIVVDSRRITDGRYETVVLFPELPEAHKLRVREFARFTR
jgi:hypothetical protein